MPKFKKELIFFFVVVLATSLFLIFKSNNKHMKLTSAAFLPGDEIPSKYTCEGENVNPPLFIEDVPENTESLALIMEDPDAPLETFDHWLIWNIKPDVMEIAENSVPIDAVEGSNGAGKSGYTGPCPPAGTHRYFFRVYALDIPFVDLPQGVKKEKLLDAIKDHTIEKAELMGKYGLNH